MPHYQIYIYKYTRIHINYIYIYTSQYVVSKLFPFWTPYWSRLTDYTILLIVIGQPRFMPLRHLVNPWLGLSFSSCVLGNPEADNGWTTSGSTNWSTWSITNTWSMDLVGWTTAKFHGNRTSSNPEHHSTTIPARLVRSLSLKSRAAMPLRACDLWVQNWSHQKHG